MAVVGSGISTSTENFGRVITENHTYVDKSLFIKEVIDDLDEATLITRPRRFGKSINMSMLQHFFASEVQGHATAGLFDSLQIASVENGRYIREHQGKYPVLLLSFRDVKEMHAEDTIERLRDLISALFSEHRSLLDSGKLGSDEVKKFNEYLDGKETIDGGLVKIVPEKLASAPQFLCRLLYKVYQQKVMVLIDEYDTPLTAAFRYNHLEPISGFMRNLFSSLMKGNPFLYKGIMTGILRISKNNMLSGLNNLRVYTLFDNKYSQYFGFMEDEMLELLQKFKQTDKLEQIKKYYNGYRIGGNTAYNPWAVMNYLSDGRLQPYWVMTSNDQLLKKILLQSSPEIKRQFMQLMQGDVITGNIVMNVRYQELIENEYALWTLLLFTGYLTSTAEVMKGTQYICQLQIPNEEILIQYTETFALWLQEGIGSRYYSFLDNLLKGRADIFTRDLSLFLFNSLSVHDVAGFLKAEAFYHGFCLGLLASIQDTHMIFSNRESGFGRYDLMIIPKDSQQSLGIILEFKQADKSVDDEAAMREAVEQALLQIEQKRYATDLQQRPNIKQILKVGLVFSKKRVASAWRTTDLKTGGNSDVEFGLMIDEEA